MGARSGPRNARLVLEAMIAVFDSGDVSSVGKIVSESYVDHQGLRGTEIRGASGFRMVVAAARSAFAELHVEPIDAIAEGDRSVARIRWYGTLRDGRVVDRETIDMIRVVDGQAVEHWGAQLSTSETST